ncbi:MAG: recombinase family protein [Sphingomonas adhaesiva]|uniref:recombinase family protein n=1 Tax=Sphingomonas adhaesiva TaxID=28212 RepID=UPI002FF66733
MVQHHPHCTRAHLRRKLVRRLARHSPFLSGVGASGKPGAVQIDIIVVYKVDRLTRSLLDFAKLVEAFDKAGTSFVSITQSFNTTTSMGRLTLNMLLSFAQFEREVTAERIRDKIAASKARGMWMGGVPPLGYKPNGRTLAIVEVEADLVRELFERYLNVGVVRQLAIGLERDGIRVPRRTTTSGKPLGGGWFTRGQLYQILRNPIYAGQIAHRELLYPGQHAAIIDDDTFRQAQELLASHIQGSRTRERASQPSPLAGKIVDASGEPLIAVHATKGNTRYRYYVSRALHHGESNTGLRVPAREIEQLVAGELVRLLADPLALAATAWLDITPDRLVALGERCAALTLALQRRQGGELIRLVEKVVIRDNGVDVLCSATGIAAALDTQLPDDAPATITLSSTARITRSGHTVRLVHNDGSTALPAPDACLIRLIVQARRWWDTLRSGGIGVTELARQEGVTRSYLCRIVRLAFLSPAVVEAILAGRQHAGLSVAALMPADAIAVSWEEQTKTMLPSERTSRSVSSK